MTKPATDEEIDAIKHRLAQAEEDYIIWEDEDISKLLARIRSAEETVAAMAHALNVALDLGLADEYGHDGIEAERIINAALERQAAA